MGFYVKSLGAGIAGVVVTALFWVAANPPTVGVVSSGQIMLTLAVVGVGAALLTGLHSLYETVRPHIIRIEGVRPFVEPIDEDEEGKL